MTTDKEKLDLDNVIQEIIQNMNHGQNEIFSISEQVKDEILTIQAQRYDLKERYLLCEKEIQTLRKKEEKARIKLFVVSKDFGKFTEKDIQMAYEEARIIQYELAQKVEELKSLIQTENLIESQIEKNQVLLDKADAVLSKLQVMQQFLLSDLNHIGQEIQHLEEKTAIGIQIIQAEEDERRRIARDIHDGPAQAISAVIIQSSVVEKIIEKDQQPLFDEIRIMREQLRTVLKDIRSIIFALRPTSLDEMGLVPILMRMIVESEARFGLHICFENQSKTRIKSSLIRMMVFRVFQETLTNIGKHANAKNVKINLSIDEQNIMGQIKDDGVGFNQNETGYSKGFGLSSMIERIEIIKGHLQIQSQIKSGTTITFSVPNQGEKYDQ